MHLMETGPSLLTHAVVTAVDEGLKRIKKAMAKRHTAKHQLNACSSRSHVIMTFTLKTSAAVPDATFALVDLAGALSPSLSSECACSKHCTVSVARLDCRKCQPACMCEDWPAVGCQGMKNYASGAGLPRHWQLPSMWMLPVPYSAAAAT